MKDRSKFKLSAQVHPSSETLVPVAHVAASASQGVAEEAASTPDRLSPLKTPPGVSPQERSRSRSPRDPTEV